MQAFENVCCAVEGQGALMQRTPVSTTPQTGLRSFVQPLTLRDSSLQFVNASRPAPAGGSLGVAVVSAVGAADDMEAATRALVEIVETWKKEHR